METRSSSPEYPLRVRAAPPREPVYRRILPFLSRRWWTILIAWLVAGLLIDGLLNLPKTGYSATATILILPPDADFAEPGAQQPADAQLIWKETRPIASDALIGEAVDRLELVRDAHWNYGSASLPPILDGFAEPLTKLGFQLRPNTAQRAHSAIIARIRHGLVIRQVNTSRLVALNLTTHVPSDSVVIVNTLADLYVEDRLNQQLAQAAAPSSGAPQVMGARIMDRAIEAEKADSMLGNLEAWSAFLGLFFGLGFARLVDHMDRGVGSAAKAIDKTGRPVIGSVPFLRGADLKDVARHRVADVVIANPMSAYAESLRNLRTSLRYADQQEPPKLICVTAVRNGDGKNTTALALGRVAALAGQRVLIVDCDLRRRALSRMVELSPEEGIVEAATGDRPWTQIVRRDPSSRADLMLVSETHYRPRDLFASPAIERLFAEFRQAYELVVVSAPPALSVAETRAISRLSDRTILVAHWTRTPASMLRSAIKLLVTTGSDVQGIVLNFVDPRARGRLTETDTAYQAKFATRYYKS